MFMTNSRQNKWGKLWHSWFTNCYCCYHFLVQQISK